MSPKDMKACPYCKRKREREVTQDWARLYFGICYGCGARTQQYMTYEEAVVAWNEGKVEASK